jgi:hypothetical protein
VYGRGWEVMDSMEEMERERERERMVEMIAEGSRRKEKEM